MKLTTWERLSNDYYNFTRKYQKQLEDNYVIDCGTDYANYILHLDNTDTGLEV